MSQQSLAEHASPVQLKEGAGVRRLPYSPVSQPLMLPSSNLPECMSVEAQKHGGA